MVSKIAVIALVAVVAVPILLGYGLNIETTDEPIWVTDGKPINASNYLIDTFDSQKSSWTSADIYQMNSNVFEKDAMIDTYPVYESTTTADSPIKLNQSYETWTTSFTISNTDYSLSEMLVKGGYNTSNYIDVTLDYGNGTTETFTHVKEFRWQWNGTRNDVSIYYYSPGNIGNKIERFVVSPPAIVCTAAVTGTVNGWIWNVDTVGTNANIDVTKGYRLNTDVSQVPNPSALTSITYATQARSFLMTFDLNTITANNYLLDILTHDHLYLKKTVTDGVVDWSFKCGQSTADWTQLYYNSASSSNTYQLYLDGSHGVEMRYTGVWSDVIGPAEPLITYPFSYPVDNGDTIGSVIGVIGHTPVMRIDQAILSAYKFNVMEDAVYDPAAFRTNPSTIVTNLVYTGDSLTFGGITYPVTKGNITLGQHSVSINNMVFSSVPVANGYENTINGAVVSVTAEPSTITFTGQWRMDVNTYAQKQDIRSVTKWEPGKFAWDGVDTNFKMAGLLSSLGAFIALAIYGRRSGAKVLPLLLVCGGAAFMFILMI